MPSPYVAHPFDGAPAVVRAGHDAIVGEHATTADVRQLVLESWLRSIELDLDPDRLHTALRFDEDDLREYRSAHPLALALPTIHRLLVRHTFDAGLIVAVGDQAGRLLWIDGDRDLRRKAEGMLFVEGADWSERAVGTSAPGTALALDHGIQIRGAEHFTRIVHPWSCTAVPVHDPSTGEVIGVIDITGGDEAVAPATLPLLEAAVAAVEAELHVQRLDHSVRPVRASGRGGATVNARPILSVLGTNTGRLQVRGATLEVTARHAEILVLLAIHPEGLSAERLAALVYEREGSVDTLRAEMVRLRRQLTLIDPELVPLSRPYRLAAGLDLDAQRVLAFLERGAHRVALGGYGGPVLPGSSAPGIREFRAGLSARLRDALLADASLDTLLAYARTDEAAWDVDVWRQCLRMLPPKSPKRATVVARLERIEKELQGSCNPSATSADLRSQGAPTGLT